jgi:hypothetical protein
VAPVNINFALVTSATCDGLKVLELYPVKLLKEIELACTFSFLILSRFSDLLQKKRMLSRKEPCESSTMFVGKFMLCWHVKERRYAIQKLFSDTIKLQALTLVTN